MRRPPCLEGGTAARGGAPSRPYRPAGTHQQGKAGAERLPSGSTENPPLLLMCAGRCVPEQEQERQNPPPPCASGGATRRCTRWRRPFCWTAPRWCGPAISGTSTAAGRTGEGGHAWAGARHRAARGPALVVRAPGTASRGSRAAWLAPAWLAQPACRVRAAAAMAPSALPSRAPFPLCPACALPCLRTNTPALRCWAMWLPAAPALPLRLALHSRPLLTPPGPALPPCPLAARWIPSPGRAATAALTTTQSRGSSPRASSTS